MTLQNHSVESPSTDGYNCIAWAYGRRDIRMWPKATPDYWWPPGVLDEDSTSAFVALYESIGYESCNDGAFEPGFEKIAIYANGDAPKHAALQLPTGKWTSKIGEREDIYHDDPSVVEVFYGSVVSFMRRKRKADAKPA